MKLDNRDQEINFAEDENDKESVPASSASSKPGPKMGGTIEPKDADFQTIDKNEIVDINETKKNKNILNDKPATK